MVLHAHQFRRRHRRLRQRVRPALRQTDLKQALAYTTLMALGTLMLFLGQESGYAMTAFATFLIVHSLYKAALFLVVGAIDKATGTREVASLLSAGSAA
ncbi:MAG TPA: hypothetical protein DIU07_05455 [Rhodobacteraceae bacterium]|nr:hypothetical protein [Paracoccaceae bacterium]